LCRELWRPRARASSAGPAGRALRMACPLPVPGARAAFMATPAGPPDAARAARAEFCRAVGGLAGRGHHRARPQSPPQAPCFRAGSKARYTVISEPADAIPLRIREARIDNFRVPGEARLELGDMTALIGSNGSGKTSLLLAIARFFSMAKTMNPANFGDKGPPWR